MVLGALLVWQWPHSEATATSGGSGKVAGPEIPTPESYQQVARKSRIDARNPLPVESDSTVDRIGWKGVVKDANGNPLSGMRVLASSFWRSRAAYSDAEGFYQLYWPSNWRWDSRKDQLLVSGNGQVAASLTAPAPHAPLTEVDFVLASGIPIRIQTIGKASGKPLAGVRVKITTTLGTLASEGLSDKEGRINLHVSRPGAYTFAVDPLSTSYTTLSLQRFVPIEGIRLPIVLQLAAYPDEIQLEAWDALKWLTLEDATFRNVERDLEPETSAAELAPLPSVAGRLTWQWFDEYVSPLILVEAQGYLPVMVVPNRERAGHVQIPMYASGTTPLRVVNEGQPLAGPAEVIVNYYPSWYFFADDPDFANLAEIPQPIITEITRTDSWGNGYLPFFVVPQQSRQPFTTSEGVSTCKVRIQGPGGLSRDFGWLDLADSVFNQRRELVFDLQPPRMDVSVQVLDEFDKPLKGYDVHLAAFAVPASDDFQLRHRRRDWGELQVDGIQSTGLTDDSGRYAHRFLVPSLLRWSVGGDIGSTASLESGELLLFQGKNETITVRVPSAAIRQSAGLGLAGWVRDRHGEMLQDPAATRVALRRANAVGTTYQDWSSVSATGEFRFANLQAGLYELTLFDESLPVMKIEALAGSREIELRTQPSRNYRIQVVSDMIAEPVFRPQLRFLTRGGNYVDWPYPPDSDGYFAIPRIPESYENLFIVQEGAEIFVRPLREASGEQVHEWTCILSPGRAVSIKVYDEEGRPADFVAALRWMNPPLNVSWIAERKSERKAFTWTHAPVSAWSVQALDSQGQEIGTPFKVPSGLNSQEFPWTLTEPGSE